MALLIGRPEARFEAGLFPVLDQDVRMAASRRKPGDRIEVAYVDRTAGARTATVALAEDPRDEVVPVESSGGVLTAAHKSFRDGWLGSAQ